ncbi:peptide ABC transporter substrate-binding protein [Testudinibacter sp. P27/CKL/0425]
MMKRCDSLSLFSLRRLVRGLGLSLLLTSLNGCDWWASLSEPKTAPQPQPELSPEAQLQQQAEARRQLLKRGLEVQAFNLQPQQLQDDRQLPLIRDLYEGLVRVDKNGMLQPAAAESWQQQDYKIWTFRLRPNLSWSNGEPLRAQDFIQSWYALAAQGNDNPLSAYLRFMALENIEPVLNKTHGVEMLGIKALDDQTLQLTLSQPVPYLPQMLSHVALLPSYQGENSGALVSNGAYRVLYGNDQELLLEKNPFYWNAPAVSFRNVSYRALNDNSLQPEALSELDLLPQLSMATALEASGKMHALHLPSLCNYYYEFNFRHPKLKQSAVRNALAGMISLPEIVADIPQARANAKFLPRQMQAQDAEQSWTRTIVEQLLAQAGVNSQNPLRLRLSYEEQGIHPQIAEKMIRMLSQSDLIQIEAEALTRQQLLEKRVAGDFDLIRSGWCADYRDPSAFLNILHSQSANNKMAFSNPQIDQLLQQSQASDISGAKRLRRYTQIENIINQEQIVLPLFQYYTPYWISRDLAGYETSNSVIDSQDVYRKVNPAAH